MKRSTGSRRSEGAVAVEEGLGSGGGGAPETRQGDVRVKGAALGLQAGGDAGALDLCGERGDRLLRIDRGPQGAAAAALENADAVDGQLKARMTDAIEGHGDVVGQRPFDFADEAQRQMQIVVGKPSQAPTRSRHSVDQSVADGLRAGGCDEQPVTWSSLSGG